MEPEKIWQQFTALPLDARREVADFIALLHERDRALKPSQQSPQVDFQTDPFIGASHFCNLAPAQRRGPGAWALFV